MICKGKQKIPLFDFFAFTQNLKKCDTYNIFLLLPVLIINTMKNKINNIKAVLGVSLFALALVAVAAPQFSYAATYAYVNQSKEVATVVAATPELAISTAPNRLFDSGVLLLNSPSDYTILED